MIQPIKTQAVEAGINQGLLETLHDTHASLQLAIEGACALLEGHMSGGRINYAFALQQASGHLMDAVENVLKAGGYLNAEGRIA